MCLLFVNEESLHEVSRRYLKRTDGHTDGHALQRFKFKVGSIRMNLESAISIRSFLLLSNYWMDILLSEVIDCKLT